MSVGSTLLGVLKVAASAIESAAVEEVGPIETAGLTALNALIADLLAKTTKATTTTT
jgi:hypothetical protein